MKEYTCVQLGHHKDIGKVCEEYEQRGWRLHTYNAAGNPGAISHYLLFEREVKSS